MLLSCDYDLINYDDGGNDDNEWTITAHNTLTLIKK